MSFKEVVIRIKRFLKTEYLRNIVGQAGIVFIAQLIPIIFSPLITRSYNENAMAEVTGMISLCGLMGVFTSFKLGPAVVLENDTNKARQLMVLIFIINILTIILISIIIASFKDFFVRSFKLDNVIYLMPLYILSFSLFGSFDNWFIRQKKFKYRAYGKIIESLSYLVFAFSVYFFIGQNEFGLAAGKILGVILALFFLIKLSRFKIPKINTAELYSLLVKYKDFPVHEMPAGFVNVISLQMLVIFLGYYYSKAEVGFFGLANMVVILPISFVSQAINSIFYQKIVEDVQLKNYRLLNNDFLKTLFLLMSCAIPGFILLWFFSESLVPYIFGSNWVLTGKVTKILSFVFLTQLIVSPLSGVLTALGKLKESAFFQYARVIFMSAALFIMANNLKLEFLDFIVGYTYCVVISYILYFILIFKSVRAKIS